MHGDSQGFPPPHTLEGAAADVDGLVKFLHVPVAGILGHSFGGKVALRHASEYAEGLRQIWIVDSTPSAVEPSSSAWRMLEVVRVLPAEFASRQDAIVALEHAGTARSVAQWMATNLKASNGRYQWNLNFAALREMLDDYSRTDLWAVVEGPPAGVEIHFCKATDSDVLDESAVARLKATARRNGRIFLHDVQGGHWLNADNPDAVVGLLSAALP